MEIKIVTLEKPRSLAVHEPKVKRGLDLYSFIAGALTVAIALGLLGGFAIRAIANEVTPPHEPQQMASKLEIPSATVLSLLETVEIGQEEQVTGQAWDVPLTDEEMTTLLEACEAGHISPAIGLGLIQVESDFDPNAVNPKSGCYGYCQLNPKYFPTDLSPVDNIRTDIEYLAYQLERYDNLEAALTAYNAGHDTGDRTYANMVLEAAAAFERKAHGKENS